VDRALEHLSEVVEARKALPPPEARRAIRLAARASLGDVAKACGVTRQAALQWEQGKTPSGPRLLAYTAALRVMREAAE
jgi:transcriptional regulator with XRE-family HTH domain